MKAIHLIMLAATALLASVAPLPAQSCKDYPYRDGFDVDKIAENKFIATASASVSFDDIDSYKDAKEDATMEAKAELARFFHQGIQSDSSVEKIVAESKTMSGTGKENVRKEAVQRIKRLRNSTQAILKGVIVLGDCYTKGTE